MTNKHTQHLIALAEKFLSGDLQADVFVDEYEGYLFDHEEDLFDDPCYAFLDAIRDVAAYYQPEPKVREADPHLIEEKQLREVVSENLDKIKTSQS